MITLRVGLVSFDSRMFNYWDLVLGGSANALCQIVARSSYGDGLISVVQPHAPETPPQIWLIDVPLPYPLTAKVLAWLCSLNVPAVVLCSHQQPLRQLSAAGSALLICHPRTLATLPLALLLRLAATSSLSDGSLYIGVEPPYLKRRGRPLAGRVGQATPPVAEQPVPLGIAYPVVLRESSVRYELPGVSPGLAYTL